VAGWTTNRLAWQQPDSRLATGDNTAAGLGNRPADTLTLVPQRVAQPGRLRGDGEGRRPAQRPLLAHEAQLSRIVEAEIIPRLMLLHRTRSLQVHPSLAPLTLTQQHVHTLTDLAVHGDADAAGRYVLSLLADGATQEQIFLDLLTPSARWMGELWEEDRFSFSQVTIGLWRLQRILHEHAEPLGRLQGDFTDPRRALLAAVPDSQHTFGVSMLAEFFGRAGWEVDCTPKSSWADLKHQVASGWIDLFGLSVSTSDSINAAAAALLEIRQASANPRLYVMVGGPMASLLPDLAQRCGADAMANNPQDALQLAAAGIQGSKNVSLT
jgi:MerR family transcriptional regulator, light-induced transcriptional regulator